MLCTQVIEKSFLPVPLQGSMTSEHLGEGIVRQALEVGENLRPERQLTLNNTGEWKKSLAHLCVELPITNQGQMVM